jgi:hypothetical protein
MQSIVVNAKKITLVFAFFLFNLSCAKKTNLKNQITIKIFSIDSETKQARVNKFDTIDVRMRGIGFLTQSFDKVGEYVTDSSGSVEIKLDSTEEYRFIIDGSNIHGSESFTEAFSKERLKDGQEVNIEVISRKNR